MTGSGFERLFGVLVAPGKTFRAIALRPTWVWPLLVLSLLTALVSFLMFQRVDMEAAFEKQLEARGQQMSAEQREAQEKMGEFMGRYMPVFATGGALFGSVFLYLLVALLLWGLLRFLGAELSFRQSFSTALHAFVPFAVSALLSLPVLFSRQEITLEEAQGGGLLASHLGALAPEGTGAVALALLSSVDFFSLWTIFLLILGFRIVARVKTGTAAAVVLLVWGLGIALKVAGATLGAGMGG